MDKKLLEIFESIKKENNDFIRKGQDIRPFIYVIDKNYRMQVVILIFKGREEKDFVRKQILKIIANKENMLGYISVFDTKLTKRNKKTEEVQVTDAILVTLYTSKEKIMEMIEYKDGKIIKKHIIKGRKKGMIDEWDFWGEKFDEFDEKSIKELKEYQRYKDEHKNLYKGL